STPDMQKGQPVCSIMALDLRCKIVNADAKKGLEAAHFHGCKNFAHIGRHPQYQRGLPVAPPKQGIMPKAQGVQGTETRVPWRRSNLFAEGRWSGQSASDRSKNERNIETDQRRTVARRCRQDLMRNI